MNNKITSYLFPTFICFYAIISILPKVDFVQEESEFFPFFCFDLYSLVPNEITNYDLLINKDSSDASYFYLDNKDLKKIKSKLRRKSNLKKKFEYEDLGVINTQGIDELINNAHSVHLVRFTGTYTELISRDSSDIQIVYQIK